MKKLLILIGIIFIFSSIPTQAQETQTPANTTSNIVTFSQNEKWGAKDSQGNILIQPIYKKMIRLGDNSWIVQNKKNKFGLIDNTGKELVPIKYLHSDRVVSKFAKFGNSNDYGIYDEYGNVIVEPIYSKVDILFGKMFLTYRNYKYGIVG